MSLIKDAKKSIFDISEKFVHNTERYSRIAKLSMDIKKAEDNIEKIQTEIGKFIIERVEKGETSFNLNEKTLKELTAKVKRTKSSIKANRKEINKLKKIDESESSKSKKINDDTGKKEESKSNNDN
ncbi:MAG: hypothetical protein SVR08_15375 [Spirochaetota bacterium]|nr:hypothetical protein [Spirochaetota bacterium]